MQNNKKVQRGAAAVAALLPAGFTPEVGVVLGTGLGCLAGDLQKTFSVPYADIPDYPLSTVASHAGRFSFGLAGGVPVVMQEGRCHLYEGYQPEEAARGVRIMAALGVNTLVVTNAAGSLNPLFLPGDIMVIADHINFTGRSPLAGMQDEYGPQGAILSRFTDMSRPYDPALIGLAETKAAELGLRLEKGVYLGLTGPQLETRAETRMFRQWGADAVGMSTIMEVIAAKHLGLKVLGFSVLSNQNLPDQADGMAETSLDEIIDVSNKTAHKLRGLIRALIPEIRPQRTDAP